jgi:diguanylate cyclase (GGDEF)-like protein
MQSKTIASQDRKDTSLIIMLVISGGICLGISPFVVLRLIAQDYIIATLNSIIVLGTGFIFIYLYLTKNTSVAGKGIVLLTLFTLSGTVLLKGAANVFWIYPALTATFFLIQPKLAAYMTSVFIFVILALIFEESSTIFLLTVAVSSVATFLFSFAFSTRMYKQADILETLATTDPLTGIGNRRKLEEKLIEVSRSITQETPKHCSLVIFDLDYFKKVNDKFGHDCGDDVRRGFVEHVLPKLNPSDSFFRFGGEEFVLVLEDTKLNDAEKMANDFRQSLESAQWDIAELQITTSAGIAEYHMFESSYEWMKRADEALYRAKEGGRNKCVVCNSPKKY